jgi:hypothetical protein
MILLRNGQTALMRRPSNSDACDMDLTSEDFGSRRQSRTQAQPPRTAFGNESLVPLLEFNQVGVTAVTIKRIPLQKDGPLLPLHSDKRERTTLPTLDF